MADDENTTQREGAPTGPGSVPGPLEPEPFDEPDDESETTTPDDEQEPEDVQAG